MKEIPLSIRITSFLTSINQYNIILIVFLFLLGTHLFDYYPWIFIAIGVFIVNWKRAKRWETLLLLLFVLSIFLTWYILDNSIIFNARLLGQFGLLFILYLVGLSIQTNPQKIIGSLEKNLFYFLFIFFIGYGLSILYSYIFLEQQNPLTFVGMNVIFQNEYKRIHANDGYLISTIITYYLTFIAILLPFILLYFKKFKENYFKSYELILLIGLSFFGIFLTTQMGRRTTIVLIILTLLYLLIVKLSEYRHKINLKNIFIISVLLISIIALGYYFLQDTTAINRLINRGFHDRRFGFWMKGLQVMIDYPFGGGYDITFSNFTKLAHNTWIDIGKDLGVIPFTLYLVLTIIFVYRLVKILFNPQITIFNKNIIMIISISLFTILMIEPVFNSDKTFFAYSLFILGVLTTLNDKENLHSLCDK